MRPIYNLFWRCGRVNAWRTGFRRPYWRDIAADTWAGIRCLALGHRRVGNNVWCQRCYLKQFAEIVR